MLSLGFDAFHTGSMFDSGVEQDKPYSDRLLHRAEMHPAAGSVPAYSKLLSHGSFSPPGVNLEECKRVCVCLQIILHTAGPISLKGQFTPKSKIHIFPLFCRAIYQSRLLWCELSSFGDIGRRDFCLLSNIMGLNGALMWCSQLQKVHLNS